jgi:hypothetical protein
VCPAEFRYLLERAEDRKSDRVVVSTAGFDLEYSNASLTPKFQDDEEGAGTSRLNYKAEVSFCLTPFIMMNYNNPLIICWLVSIARDF